MRNLNLMTLVAFAFVAFATATPASAQAPDDLGLTSSGPLQACIDNGNSVKDCELFKRRCESPPKPTDQDYKNRPFTWLVGEGICRDKRGRKYQRVLGPERTKRKKDTTLTQSAGDLKETGGKKKTTKTVVLGNGLIDANCKKGKKIGYGSSAEAYDPTNISHVNWLRKEKQMCDAGSGKFAKAPNGVTWNDGACMCWANKGPKPKKKPPPAAPPATAKPSTPPPSTPPPSTGTGGTAVASSTDVIGMCKRVFPGWTPSDPKAAELSCLVDVVIHHELVEIPGLKRQVEDLMAGRAGGMSGGATGAISVNIFNKYGGVNGFLQRFDEIEQRSIDNERRSTKNERAIAGLRRDVNGLLAGTAGGGRPWWQALGIKFIFDGIGGNLTFQGNVREGDTLLRGWMGGGYELGGTALFDYDWVAVGFTSHFSPGTFGESTEHSRFSNGAMSALRFGVGIEALARPLHFLGADFWTAGGYCKYARKESGYQVNRNLLASNAGLCGLKTRVDVPIWGPFGVGAMGYLGGGPEWYSGRNSNNVLKQGMGGNFELGGSVYVSFSTRVPTNTIVSLITSGWQIPPMFRSEADQTSTDAPPPTPLRPTSPPPGSPPPAPDPADAGDDDGDW